MANIGNIFRRLFKPRKEPRFAVKEGTFVIISSGAGDIPEQKVQLIDISQGGMAFIYNGSPSDLEKSGILKMIKKSDYDKDKIDFDTVSDLPVVDGLQSPVPLRKRGVKFKWMGYFEQAELREFINTVGTFKK